MEGQPTTRKKKRPQRAAASDRDVEAEPLPRIPVASSGWILWAVVGPLLVVGAVVAAHAGMKWAALLMTPIVIAALSAFGLWASSAPRWVGRLGAWVRRHPVATVLILTPSCVIGGFGSYVTYVEHREVEEKCATNRRVAAEYLSNGNLDGARKAVATARSRCGAEYAAELATLAEQLSAAEQAEASREAEVMTQQAALREEAAVTTWPQDATATRKELQEGDALASKKDLAKAAPKLKRAQWLLAQYKGTSIETTAEWRMLDEKAAQLQAKVQPYLDQVQADLDEAQRLLAAENEKDRRDGVKVTKDGFIAAVTLEKLERATKYAAANDKEGLSLLVQQDPGTMILKPGLRVMPIERAGLVGGYVRVRLKGSLDEVWTYPEALRDP